MSSPSPPHLPFKFRRKGTRKRVPSNSVSHKTDLTRWSSTTGRSLSPSLEPRSSPDLVWSSSSPVSSSAWAPSSPGQSSSSADPFGATGFHSSPRTVSRTARGPWSNSRLEDAEDLYWHHSNYSKSTSHYVSYPYSIRRGSSSDIAPTLVSDVEPSEYSEDIDVDIMDDEDFDSEISHSRMSAVQVQVEEEERLTFSESDERSHDGYVKPPSMKSCSTKRVSGIEDDIVSALLDLHRQPRLGSTLPLAPSTERSELRQTSLPSSSIPSSPLSVARSIVDELQVDMDRDNVKLTFHEDAIPLLGMTSEGTAIVVETTESFAVIASPTPLRGPPSPQPKLQSTIDHLEQSDFTRPEVMGEVPYTSHVRSSTSTSTSTATSSDSYQPKRPTQSMAAKKSRIVDVDETESEDGNDPVTDHNNAANITIASCSGSQPLGQKPISSGASLPKRPFTNNRTNQLIQECFGDSPLSSRPTSPSLIDGKPTASGKVSTKQKDAKVGVSSKVETDVARRRKRKHSAAELETRPSSPALSAASTSSLVPKQPKKKKTASKRRSRSPSSMPASQSLPTDAATSTKSVSALESKADPLNAEIHGFLIEVLAMSRASSMPTSSLHKEVMKSQPQLDAQYPGRSKKTWLQELERVLTDSPVFGTVDRNRTNAADKHLEPQWFYIPENDEDQDRAALISSMMPKKRTETKKFKQYYYRPLPKISRWDAEDDV